MFYSVQVFISSPFQRSYSFYYWWNEQTLQTFLSSATSRSGRQKTGRNCAPVSGVSAFLYSGVINLLLVILWDCCHSYESQLFPFLAHFSNMSALTDGYWFAPKHVKICLTTRGGCCPSFALFKPFLVFFSLQKLVWIIWHFCWFIWI